MLILPLLSLVIYGSVAIRPLNSTSDFMCLVSGPLTDGDSVCPVESDVSSRVCPPMNVRIAKVTSRPPMMDWKRNGSVMMNRPFKVFRALISIVLSAPFENY